MSEFAIIGVDLANYLWQLQEAAEGEPVVALSGASYPNLKQK